MQPLNVKLRQRRGCCCVRTRSRKGRRAASSASAGFWLSNGATSSSESNCNYVYIVADDDGDGDVRRFISSVVAVALTTEEERERLNVLIMNSWNGSWIIKVDQSFVRGPHACLEIILNYKIAIKQDRQHTDKYEASTRAAQAKTCAEFGGTN